MHVATWEMKRAHWKLTTFARRTWEDISGRIKEPLLEPMTPARFDVLFVLWQRPHGYPRRRQDHYEMTMRMLVAKLGLHPSTVSKCVSRMVELGWLTKTTWEEVDRRQVIVALTAEGLDAFELASKFMFEDSEPWWRAQHPFAARICLPPLDPEGAPVGGPRHRPSETDDDRLRWLGRLLRACAVNLGSRSYPVYDPAFDDPSLVRHHFHARFECPGPIEYDGARGRLFRAWWRGPEHAVRDPRHAWTPRQAVR